MYRKMVVAWFVLLVASYPVYTSSIKHLPSPVLTYDFENQLCPSACKCEADDQDGVRVQCVDQSLTELPRTLPQYTISLDLTGNPLLNITRASFAHLKLAALKKLVLTRTSLTFIAPDAFQDLLKLQEVFLDENLLSIQDIKAVLSSSRKVKGHFGNRCQEIKSQFVDSVVVCDGKSTTTSSPSTTSSSPSTTTTSPPMTSATSVISITKSSVSNTTSLQVISGETEILGDEESGINKAVWIPILVVCVVFVIGIFIFFWHRRLAVNEQKVQYDVIYEADQGAQVVLRVEEVMAESRDENVENALSLITQHS